MLDPSIQLRGRRSAWQRALARLAAGSSVSDTAEHSGSATQALSCRFQARRVLSIGRSGMQKRFSTVIAFRLRELSIRTFAVEMRPLHVLDPGVRASRPIHPLTVPSHSLAPDFRNRAPHPLPFPGCPSPHAQTEFSRRVESPIEVVAHLVDFFREGRIGIKDRSGGRCVVKQVVFPFRDE